MKHEFMKQTGVKQNSLYCVSLLLFFYNNKFNGKIKTF